jgi:hypothetical protein
MLSSASGTLNGVPGMREKVLKAAQYGLRLAALRAAGDRALQGRLSQAASMLSLCRKAMTLFETLRELLGVLEALDAWRKAPGTATEAALVQALADFFTQANAEVRAVQGGFEGRERGAEGWQGGGGRGGRAQIATFAKLGGASDLLPPWWDQVGSAAWSVSIAFSMAASARKVQDAVREVQRSRSPPSPRREGEGTGGSAGESAEGGNSAAKRSASGSRAEPSPVALVRSPSEVIADRSRRTLISEQLQLGKLAMDALSAVPCALGADSALPDWWDPLVGLLSAIFSILRLLHLATPVPDG